MRSGLFSTVFADQEERARAALMPGLRYAEVVRIEDEGYILEWLTGTVCSESAPARVARFMAGKERGAYFPFEVGDEVVVGFEDGNIDRPVILGGLWSDEDAPPANVDTSSDNNTRSIVSREKSELTFNDKKSETGVLLKSAGGMQLKFDDKASAPKVALESKGGIKLTFEDKEGARKARLETPGGIKLTFDDVSSAPKAQLETKAGIQLVFDDTPGATKATLKLGGMKLEFDGTAQTIRLELNASTYIELAAAGITVKGTRIDLN